MSPVAAPAVPRRCQSARSRVAVAFLSLAAPGCGAMYCADPPEVSSDPPTVSALHVIPELVFVRPPATFVLRARILDANLGALPEHPQLEWKVDAPLTALTEGGDSIVVRAEQVTSMQSPSVSATLPGWTAGAQVKILAPATPGPPDTIVADNRIGVAPDVVLVHDGTGAGPTGDSMVAFVGTGLLGDFKSGTGEVVRFSTDRGFEIRPWSWQPGPDRVDLTTGALTPEARAAVQAGARLSFTITQATTGDERGTISLDVGFAFSVLARQRTGVVLDSVVRTAAAFGNFVLELDDTPERPCLGLGQQLERLGVDRRTLRRDSLNVVYVDDIVGPAGASTGYSGYSCPFDNQVGAVIFISELERSGPTLAHEMGHALGLMEPAFGHTWGLQGFSYTNLMWTSASDAEKGARATLTLGQAFRMNLDSNSWLVRLGLWTGMARRCDSLRVPGACPLLDRDIRGLP